MKTKIILIAIIGITTSCTARPIISDVGLKARCPSRHCPAEVVLQNKVESNGLLEIPWKEEFIWSDKDGIYLFVWCASWTNFYERPSSPDDVEIDLITTDGKEWRAKWVEVGAKKKTKPVYHMVGGKLHRNNIPVNPDNSLSIDWGPKDWGGGYIQIEGKCIGLREDGVVVWKNKEKHDEE